MGIKVEEYKKFLDEKYVELDRLANANMDAKMAADEERSRAYVDADNVYSEAIIVLEEKASILAEAADLELAEEAQAEVEKLEAKG